MSVIAHVPSPPGFDWRAFAGSAFRAFAWLAPLFVLGLYLAIPFVLKF